MKLQMISNPDFVSDDVLSGECLSPESEEVLDFLMFFGDDLAKPDGANSAHFDATSYTQRGQVETGTRRSGNITAKDEIPIVTKKRPAPAMNVREIVDHVMYAKDRRKERNKLLSRKTREKKKQQVETLIRRVAELEIIVTNMRAIIQNAGLQLPAESDLCIENPALLTMMHQESENQEPDGSADFMNDIDLIPLNDTKSSFDKEEGGVVDLELGIPTAPKKSTGTAHSEDMSVLHCVVVEDSIVQAKMVCRQLMALANEERIIKVYRCSTAETAMKFIDTGIQTDLWFIDQHLGSKADSLKGSDIILKIREKPGNERTILVGLTAEPLQYYGHLHEAGVDIVWGKADLNRTIGGKLLRLLP